MAQPQITVKKQQELQQQYTNYKNNLQQLAQKIGDIEQDTEEHKLVLETLTPLPPDRKCFRMVNGVLVEKTVKDVTPALQINSEGLKKVLEELVKQYKRQQDDMEKWKSLDPNDIMSASVTEQEFFRRAPRALDTGLSCLFDDRQHGEFAASWMESELYD